MGAKRPATPDAPLELNTNTNYPTTDHFYSALLAIMGRSEQASEEAHCVLALDPLSVPINNMVGEIYKFAGRLGTAIAQYRRALELDPKMALVRENLGIAWSCRGRTRRRLKNL